MPLPSDKTLQADTIFQELLALQTRINFEVSFRYPTLKEGDAIDPSLMARSVELIAASISHLRRIYGLSEKQAHREYSRMHELALHAHSTPAFLARVSLHMALTYPLPG